MKVWDLHCDTLYRLLGREDTAGEPAVEAFAKDGGMLDLAKMRAGDYLLQCFACFVGLEESPDPLVSALREADLFHRLLAAYPDEFNALLNKSRAKSSAPSFKSKGNDRGGK